MLYSIVVLLFMAFVALSLSIFLRRKFYCLSRFDFRRPEIYDKVYVVFEPYSQITVFHRFLLLIVVIVWYCCFLLVYFFFSALKAGLFLPFVLGAICLNMLPLEMVFEVVSNSNSFIRAMKDGVKLGVGDLEVFSSLRKALRKMSNYCFGVSIFLFVSALIFPLIWSWLFSGLSSFFSFFPQDFVGTQFLIIVITVIYAIVGFLVSIIKRHFFVHE